MSATPPDSRPLSPHLQVYRPQLTSVLSFAHRATGVVNLLALVALVYWLAAAAAGVEAYAQAVTLLASPPGIALAVLFSYAFFYHMCNGIRHLVWDAGRSLELPAVYRSGWLMVAASVVLTAAFWLLAVGGGTA